LQLHFLPAADIGARFPPKIGGLKELLREKKELERRNLDRQTTPIKLNYFIPKILTVCRLAVFTLEIYDSEVWIR
jgi:hypothetical protein